MIEALHVLEDHGQDMVVLSERKLKPIRFVKLRADLLPDGDDLEQ